MTSRENMAWNFIDKKSSKKVSEVNGNGGNRHTEFMTHSSVYQRKETRHNDLIAICFNLMMGPNCNPK